MVGACFCLWRCLLKGAAAALNEYDPPSVLPSLCSEVSEVGFEASTFESAAKGNHQPFADAQVLDVDLDLDVEMGAKGSVAANGGDKSASKYLEDEERIRSSSFFQGVKQ